MDIKEIRKILRNKFGIGNYRIKGDEIYFSSTNAEKPNEFWAFFCYLSEFKILHNQLL